ncbi:MAG: hypothetical protein LBN21_01620 [Treponema sp.]|jgi:hypothetical protein|nr:hypothetical protein [Treponema sp.]
MGTRYAAFFLCLLLGASPLIPAQELPAADPGALVGLTLEALLNRFGPPKRVYAARGAEEWQDDVVFVYNDGDYYVASDRVWQIGVKAAYGIKQGDPKAAAVLIAGEEGEDHIDHLRWTLPNKGGRGWPLVLRCNFDTKGMVQEIFIFRPDF